MFCSQCGSQIADNASAAEASQEKEKGSCL